MKVLLFFLLLCACLSYFIYRHEAVPVPPLVSKRVAEKPLPVATKGEHNIDNPLFHLVADDGTYVEVGPTTYARTKVGEEYASREWKGSVRPS